MPRAPEGDPASAGRGARRPRSRAPRPTAGPCSRGVSVTVTGMRQVRSALPDQLGAAGQQLRVDRPGALVDEAAHGGFDEAFEQGFEARAVDRGDVLVGPGRRAQQPDHDGDVVDQVEDRRRLLGVGADRLDPGRFDRRQPLARRGSCRAPPSPPRAARSRGRGRCSRSRRSVREPRRAARRGRWRGAVPRWRRGRDVCGRCGCRSARRTPSRSGPRGRRGRRGRPRAAARSRPCSGRPRRAAPAAPAAGRAPSR